MVWSEDTVLSEVFKETSTLFNPEKTKSFQEMFCGKKEDKDPMVLYKRFPLIARWDNIEPVEET
jgi:hypothetical protein